MGVCLESVLARSFPVSNVICLQTGTHGCMSRICAVQNNCRQNNIQTECTPCVHDLLVITCLYAHGHAHGKHFPTFAAKVLCSGCGFIIPCNASVQLLDVCRDNRSATTVLAIVALHCLKSLHTVKKASTLSFEIALQKQGFHSNVNHLRVQRDHGRHVGALQVPEGIPDQLLLHLCAYPAPLHLSAAGLP